MHILLVEDNPVAAKSIELKLTAEGHNVFATDMGEDAIELAEALAQRVAPLPVRLADERLTTVSAQRSLRAAGVRGKDQRAVIDQAAAVVILQSWLDQRRATRAGSGAEFGAGTIDVPEAGDIAGG